MGAIYAKLSDEDEEKLREIAEKNNRTIKGQIQHFIENNKNQ